MSVAETCNDGINWGLKILNGLISPVLLPTVHIPSPRQVPCHSYSIFFSLFWYLQHPCIAIAIQVLHSKLHRMASQGLVGGTLTLTHIVQIKWLSRTLMKASITLSMLDFLYLQNYLGTARPPWTTTTSGFVFILGTCFPRWFFNPGNIFIVILILSTSTFF